MFKTRRSWVLAILAVLALVVLWYLTASPRGWLMAHLDHARGHYDVKLYGLHKTKARYKQLLKEHYGVEMTEIAGCFVEDWEIAYAEAYNSVSKELLRKKYGLDIFKECYRLAEQN